MFLAMLETDGDRERFLRLHGAYEKKLYAVALRLLGDPAQAEDAVQQAWLRVLEHWERVLALPWEETEGYVVTVVKNAAVDLARSARRTAPCRRTGTRPPRTRGRRSTAAWWPWCGCCRRATARCWS